jgi:hypothetical protein
LKIILHINTHERKFTLGFNANLAMSDDEHKPAARNQVQYPPFEKANPNSTAKTRQKAPKNNSF